MMRIGDTVIRVRPGGASCHLVWAIMAMLWGIVMAIALEMLGFSHEVAGIIGFAPLFCCHLPLVLVIAGATRIHTISVRKVRRVEYGE
jgi:hypothetical protein